MPASSQIGSRVLDKLRQALNPEKSGEPDQLIAKNNSEFKPGGVGTKPEGEASGSQFFSAQQKGTVV
jgi:hypothetical protein